MACPRLRQLRVRRPGSETTLTSWSDWVRATTTANGFGQGVQRGYGLTEKRFALFNVSRFKDARDNGWAENLYPYEKARQVPDCVTTVPLLARVDGANLTDSVNLVIEVLESHGSVMVPGFAQPEGVVIFHEGVSAYFKAFTQWESK